MKSGPPAVVSFGLRLVITGAGTAAVMVKCAADDWLPELLFSTITAAVPGVARSVAAISAVSSVLLMNVVGRATPFHLTTELAEKSVPITVSGNAMPPAEAEAGSSRVIVGVLPGAGPSPTTKL